MLAGAVFRETTVKNHSNCLKNEKKMETEATNKIK